VGALARSVEFRFADVDVPVVGGAQRVGGSVGSLLLGFVADATLTADGADGVFFRGVFGSIAEQVRGVDATVVCSCDVTFGIVFVLSKVLPGGIRVSDEDEDSGLDLSQHSETGYALERV